MVDIDSVFSKCTVTQPTVRWSKLVEVIIEIAVILIFVK